MNNNFLDGGSEGKVSGELYGSENQLELKTAPDSDESTESEANGPSDQLDSKNTDSPEDSGAQAENNREQKQLSFQSSSRTEQKVVVGNAAT